MTGETEPPTVPDGLLTEPRPGLAPPLDVKHQRNRPLDVKHQRNRRDRNENRLRNSNAEAGKVRSKFKTTGSTRTQIRRHMAAAQYRRGATIADNHTTS